MIRRPALLCHLALLAACPLPAQDTRATDSARGKPVVALLGASLSAGFSCTVAGIGENEKNQTIALKRALAPVWPRDKVDLRDYSDVLLFTDPIGLGTKKARAALRAGPELVVGVDFLFWFGYGHLRTTQQSEAEARLELLQKGFALLEGFTCPVLVGDFPDMTGADPRMLHPRQVPSVETQQKLNEAVRAWAKGKPNVRVFGLADYVAVRKRGGEAVDDRGQKRELPLSVLIQEDKLHPTRLGVAVLLLHVLPEVTAMLPEGSALRPGRTDFATLVDALDLRADVPAASVPR